MKTIKGVRVGQVTKAMNHPSCIPCFAVYHETRYLPQPTPSPPHAPQNDTSAEADTSVDSTPEQPPATIEIPVVENRAEGAEHPAPVAMVAVSEATGGLPEDGETLDVVSPVEDDDDVTEAPTAVSLILVRRCGCRCQFMSTLL